MMLDARPDLVGRAIATGSSDRRGDQHEDQADEANTHRSEYTVDGPQAAAGRTAASSRSRRSITAQSMLRKKASTYFFLSVAL